SNESTTLTINSITGNGDSFTIDTSAGEYTVSMNPESEDYITKVIGTSPLSRSGLYVYSNFESTDKSFSNYANVTVTSASRQLNFSGQDASSAKTPFIQSQDINGTQYDLFKLH
ncbi:hypothetical protein RZS08_40010, partial [Arthrospira platensis SPKY1]|nr:hypothetical protein [Arthrospira platensis SPKY1]